MKKTITGTLLTGVLLSTVLAGAAMAADMPVKAPLFKAPVYTWTGCYLGGGAGYGMWNQDAHLENATTLDQFTPQTTNGGRGWFGTVSGGCDYQLNTNIVIGVLGDGDFGSLKGTYNDGEAPASWGNETMQSAWYVGGRIGWLVTPTLLSYFDAGYTQAHFSQIDLFFDDFPSTPEGVSIGAHTYGGYFLGGGVEYALPMFSGLFWRNEYRFASYDAADLREFVASTGELLNIEVHAQKYVQTVRTELIWRFNMH